MVRWLGLKSLPFEGCPSFFKTIPSTPFPSSLHYLVTSPQYHALVISQSHHLGGGSALPVERGKDPW
jgi:hypothetical protein